VGQQVFTPLPQTAEGGEAVNFREKRTSRKGAAHKGAEKEFEEQRGSLSLGKGQCQNGIADLQAHAVGNIVHNPADTVPAVRQTEGGLEKEGDPELAEKFDTGQGEGSAHPILQKGIGMESLGYGRGNRTGDADGAPSAEGENRLGMAAPDQILAVFHGKGGSAGGLFVKKDGPYAVALQHLLYLPYRVFQPRFGYKENPFTQTADFNSQTVAFVGPLKNTGGNLKKNLCHEQTPDAFIKKKGRAIRPCL
jgi:hypothetical protein